MPGAGLGSALPVTVNGTMTSSSNTHWTAPAAGTYVFDTIGSSMDGVLGVLAGADCAGASLGCDADIQLFTERAARVTATLAQGQTITLVVEAQDTDSQWRLHAEHRSAVILDH